MLMMQVYKSGKEFIACFTRSYVVDQSAHTFNCLEMSMLRLMINIRLGLHRSDGLLSHDASLDWKLDVNNFYVSAAFQCVTVVCSCEQQKVMNNSVEFRRKKTLFKKRIFENWRWWRTLDELTVQEILIARELIIGSLLRQRESQTTLYYHDTSFYYRKRQSSVCFRALFKVFVVT